MSDRAAFLRAIRECPDDDTPRLVFADWLEEHGSRTNLNTDWAGLIRTQIEIHRMVNSDEARTEAYDDRFTLLWNRERQLLDGPLGKWFAAELDPSLDHNWATRFDLNGVQRGFPDTLDPCSGTWWPRFGDRLLAWFPITCISFGRIPLCEWKYGSIHFLEMDGHYSNYVISAEKTDEPTTLAACHERWPGVRFQLSPVRWDLLFDNIEPDEDGHRMFDDQERIRGDKRTMKMVRQFRRAFERENRAKLTTQK